MMGPWGEAKLLFLSCFVLFTCYCAVTLAEVPVDCCLSVKNKAVGKQLIVDYRQQSAGHGCSINATILVTRRGRTLCVPPDELWVQELMSHVEHLREKCKNNDKTRRCVGVRRV